MRSRPSASSHAIASVGRSFIRHYLGENGLSEKRIQQVLEIEEQAEAIHAAALKEAEQLPIQAEKEAQALLEKARSEAETEAQRILASVNAEEETARILADAEEKARRLDAPAMTNFDRAVAYVISKVINRE